MKELLYLFMIYIENSEEEKDSLAKLKETLPSKLTNRDISNHIIEQTLHFIKTVFEDWLYRLCHCVYMWTLFGWVGHTCTK